MDSELYSFRLFTIVEYSIISLFIFKLIESNQFKNIIKLGSITFLLAAILDIYTSSFTDFDSLPTGLESKSVNELAAILVIYTSSFTDFDSLPTGLESILILAYCLFFIYERITSTSFSFNGTVWITTGFILFFSGTFFLFILSQNNFKDSSFILTYGYIVAIFSIIKNMFITIGIATETNNSKGTNHKLQKA